MFGPAGHAYVYFTYGMHHCFNVVTEAEDTPGAVLIRGLDGIEAANGPARLCRALDIDLRHNRVDVTTSASLWLEPGRRSRHESVVQTTRIGIRTAADLQWRFYLTNSAGVSKPDRSAEREAGQRRP
jgi:DNA-3-methyladenine glycosylase